MYRPGITGDTMVASTATIAIDLLTDAIRSRRAVFRCSEKPCLQKTCRPRIDVLSLRSGKTRTHGLQHEHRKHGGAQIEHNRAAEHRHPAAGVLMQQRGQRAAEDRA